MPNIEIHGFSEESAKALKREIFQLFKDRPYVEEMVVTVYPTTVKNKQNQDQPFIRLANSCQIHTQEIMGKLQTLVVDIEYLELKAFIPKKAEGCTKPVISWKGEDYIVEARYPKFFQLRNVRNRELEWIKMKTWRHRKDNRLLDDYQEIQKLILEKERG